MHHENVRVGEREKYNRRAFYSILFVVIHFTFEAKARNMLDEKPRLEGGAQQQWLEGERSVVIGTSSSSSETSSMCCTSLEKDSNRFALEFRSHLKEDINMKKDITSCKAQIEDFEILKLLGKGAYGKVYQVRKVYGPNKGQIFAMKAIHKTSIVSSQTDLRHTKSERDVLVEVDHPFIVHLHYAFETRRRLYLVQEFCNGGELFRRMEVERMMTEDDAKFYLSEIVCAIEYLHERDIIYRDLKTENVMLDTDGHVRLIDFGLSKMNMTPGATTTTFCGTVEYMAPEVISKGTGYSKPSDWWSFGVFTYDLLTGRSPFYSNQGKNMTKQRILNGKLTLPIYVTRDAQDMIKKLLRRPVARRLGTHEGAVEIKTHCFFKGTNWEDVLNKSLKPPFIPHVRSNEDVSNFDERFTSKVVSRESTDETMEVAKAATKDSVSFDEEEPCLFPDFDYVSPEMMNGHIDDKLLNLQDLRIRGYGNP